MLTDHVNGDSFGGGSSSAAAVAATPTSPYPQDSSRVCRSESPSSARLERAGVNPPGLCLRTSHE